MPGGAILDDDVGLRDAGVNLPVLLFEVIMPNRESIGIIIDNDLSQFFTDRELAEKYPKQQK